MKINKINANAIQGVFNKSDEAGFNSQIRFICEHAKEAKRNVVEVAKDYQGADKKQLQEKARADKAYNKTIDDCAKIVEALNITSKDIHNAKTLKDLKKRVWSRIPNTTATGKAVKFASFSKFLQEKITGVNSYFIVKECTAIEAIAIAAEADINAPKHVYNITRAPKYEAIPQKDEDGNPIMKDGREVVIFKPKSFAGGDILNAEGKRLIGDRYTEVCESWDIVALNVATANRLGRQATEAEKSRIQELKLTSEEVIEEYEETQTADTTTKTEQPEQNTEQPKAEETKKTPKRSQASKVA